MPINNRNRKGFKTIYDLLALLVLMLLSSATVVYLVLLALEFCGILKRLK
jgi:hypothetical protein